MDKQSSVLTALTVFNIIENNHAESKKIGVQVNIEKGGTWTLDKQNAVITALTALKIIKNNHPESKKISVQVNIERDETEEHHVDTLNAVLTALTTL